MAFFITSIGTIILAFFGWLAVQHVLRERSTGGSRAIEVVAFLGIFVVLVPVVFYLGLPRRLASVLEYVAEPRVERPEAKIAASPTGTVEVRPGQTRYLIRLPKKPKPEVVPTTKTADKAEKAEVKAIPQLPLASWSPSTGKGTFELNGKRKVIDLSSVILKPGQKTTVLKYQGPPWEEYEEVRFTRGLCLRSFKEARFGLRFKGSPPAPIAGYISTPSITRPSPDDPNRDLNPVYEYQVEAPADTALPEVSIEFVYYREWKDEIYQREFKAGIPFDTTRETKVSEQTIIASTDDWIVTKVMVKPGDSIFFGPFDSAEDCTRLKVCYSGGRPGILKSLPCPEGRRVHGRQYLLAGGTWGPYAVWVMLEHGLPLQVTLSHRKPFQEPLPASELKEQRITPKVGEWTITNIFCKKGDTIEFSGKDGPFRSAVMYSDYENYPGRIQVSIGGSEPFTLGRATCFGSIWEEVGRFNNIDADSLDTTPNPVWVRLTQGPPFEVCIYHAVKDRPGYSQPAPPGETKAQTTPDAAKPEPPVIPKTGAATKTGPAQATSKVNASEKTSASAIRKEGTAQKQPEPPPESKKLPSNCALQFRGKNDLVYMKDTGRLRFSRELTITCWVYLESYTGNTILRKCTPGEEDIWLRVTGRAELIVYPYSSYTPVVASPGKLLLKEWTHLACTYDARSARLYVNGALCGQNNVTSEIGSGTGPLVLGATTQWGNPLPSFAGKLDELALYNRALTDREIKEVMKTKLTGREPGLVAYYTFDEGKDSQVVDHSGHGNHGQFGSDGPAWVEGKEFARTLMGGGT